MKHSNLSTLLAALAVTSLPACELISLDGYAGDAKKSDSGTGVCSNPASLETGDDFVCTLKADGSLWCWGSNVSGQVGNNPQPDPTSGRFGDVNLPTQVNFPGNVKIKGVSAGGYFGCAIDYSDSLWCWGDDTYGQIGIDPSSSDAGAGDASASDAGTADAGTTTAFNVLVPSPIGGDLSKDVQFVSSGWYHVCVVRKSDSSVWCWGKNDSGQLGLDSSTAWSSKPIQVQLPKKATYISAGSYHTCAVLEDSTAWCWGQGSNGQLGYGGLDQQNSPIQVTGPDFSVPDAGADSSTADDAGSADDSGLDDAGANDASSPEASTAAPLDGIIAITSGAAQSCALKNNGIAYCWGSCKFGEMGDGRTKDATCIQSYPKQLPLANVKQISSGVFNICATTSDSKGYCWGRDDWGQCGNGSTVVGSLSNPDGVSIPTQVAPLGDQVVSMNPGYNHACSLLKDNTIRCWGRNKVYQLGNGVSSDPNDPEKNNSLLPITTVAACQ
jgi:alpha-tubulin suppressor-like RCC1 family protein